MITREIDGVKIRSGYSHLVSHSRLTPVSRNCVYITSSFRKWPYLILRELEELRFGGFADAHGVAYNAVRYIDEAAVVAEICTRRPKPGITSGGFQQIADKVGAGKEMLHARADLVYFDEKEFAGFTFTVGDGRSIDVRSPESLLALR